MQTKRLQRQCIQAYTLSFQYYFIPLRQPAEIKTMLKELALLVTLLTLLADARPQRFQVCDHWGHTIDHWDDFMQEPLNDLDEMSEEVDINGPLTFDDDLLNNNDDIRKNSESLTFQVRMR